MHRAGISCPCLCFQVVKDGSESKTVTEHLSKAPNLMIVRFTIEVCGSEMGRDDSVHLFGRFPVEIAGANDQTLSFEAFDRL